MTEKIKLINAKEDPIILFSEWFEEAKQKEINDPNAMNLSTISESLMPSSRIVLLKSFDKNGFVFYTNVESKKGNSINLNPQVSLNFHWKSLLRQIRIEGVAKLVTNKEADEYFDIETESPYMLLVASVKRQRRNKINQDHNYHSNDDLLKTINQSRSDIPAVTHIDYSARVQTINPNDKHDYYQLISIFEKLIHVNYYFNTTML